jgi:hypothetical protein
VSIETIPIGSDLCITLHDQTSHYFGGYYHVKVCAYCDIPLQPCYFENADEFKKAEKLMGNSVRFERILEKMAVPETDREAVRDQLTHAFQETARTYLQSLDFIPRFVRNEYRERLKKSSSRRTF